MVTVKATWEQVGLHSVLALTRKGGLDRAIARACNKAGATALRDMRSEASKRIRARKRIKARDIAKALRLRKPSRSLIEGEWAVDVSGVAVPLIAYPHREIAGTGTQGRSRRTGKFTSGVRGGGVQVEVNRGKRTLLKEAFIARMKSGHEGIFMRRGPKSLPINELLGSRPVDALLHAGEAEAVAARGARSLGATFERLLPLEIAKVRR